MVARAVKNNKPFYLEKSHLFIHFSLRLAWYLHIHPQSKWLGERDDLDTLSTPLSSAAFMYFRYGFVDFEVREATEDGAADLLDTSNWGTR